MSHVNLISKRLHYRPPVRQDGVMAFTGILVGALLGALCWVIIGLVVWAGAEALK